MGPTNSDSRPYGASELSSILLNESDQPWIKLTWKRGSLQDFTTAKEARRATDPQEPQLTLQDDAALKHKLFHSQLLHRLLFRPGSSPSWGRYCLQRAPSHALWQDSADGPGQPKMTIFYLVQPHRLTARAPSRERAQRPATACRLCHQDGRFVLLFDGSLIGLNAGLGMLYGIAKAQSTCIGAPRGYLERRAWFAPYLAHRLPAGRELPTAHIEAEDLWTHVC